MTATTLQLVHTLCKNQFYDVIKHAAYTDAKMRNPQDVILQDSWNGLGCMIKHFIAFSVQTTIRLVIAFSEFDDRFSRPMLIEQRRKCQSVHKAALCKIKHYISLLMQEKTRLVMAISEYGIRFAWQMQIEQRRLEREAASLKQRQALEEKQRADDDRAAQLERNEQFHKRMHQAQQRILSQIVEMSDMLEGKNTCATLRATCATLPAKRVR